MIDGFNKEQFGLGGIQTQVLIDIAFIDAAGKGRVGHDNIVLVRFVEAFAERVLVIDVGFVDAVHHQVHQSKPDHGAVEVIAPQTFIQDAFGSFREAGADRGPLEAILIGLQILGALFEGQLRHDILIPPSRKPAVPHAGSAIRWPSCG